MYMDARQKMECLSGAAWQSCVLLACCKLSIILLQKIVDAKSYPQAIFFMKYKEINQPS